MATKKKGADSVIKLKDSPNLGEIFGRDVGSEYTFTPEPDFLRFKVDPKLWYSFKLKPLSSAQKHTIEGWIREISIQGALWAKKNGLNVANFARRFATPDDLEQCKKLDINPTDAGFFDPEMDEDLKNSVIAEKVAYTKYLRMLENSDKKYKLIQENVIGLNKYFTINVENEAVPSRFKKQKNHDYISKVQWDTVPSKIKESVYQDLLEKANLTLHEVASL